MRLAPWSVRVARGEVCVSCADPPLPGMKHCKYHLERRRLLARAETDPSVVVPPPRPKRRPPCRVCGEKHLVKACPRAKSAKVAQKSEARRVREAARAKAGVCVQCEDKLEAGSKKRRCGPCREYNAEKSRESYQNAKLRREAAVQPNEKAA